VPLEQNLSLSPKNNLWILYCLVLGSHIS
jgi:hypothetical protein